MQGAHLVELDSAVPGTLVLASLALDLQQTLDSFKRRQDRSGEDARSGTCLTALVSKSVTGSCLFSKCLVKGRRGPARECTGKTDSDKVEVLVGVLLAENLLAERVTQEAQRVHRRDASKRRHHAGGDRGVSEWAQRDSGQERQMFEKSRAKPQDLEMGAVPLVESERAFGLHGLHGAIPGARVRRGHAGLHDHGLHAHLDRVQRVPNQHQAGTAEAACDRVLDHSLRLRHLLSCSSLSTFGSCGGEDNKELLRQQREPA